MTERKQVCLQERFLDIVHFIALEEWHLWIKAVSITLEQWPLYRFKLIEGVFPLDFANKLRMLAEGLDILSLVKFPTLACLIINIFEVVLFECLHPKVLKI